MVQTSYVDRNTGLTINYIMDQYDNVAVIDAADAPILFKVTGPSGEPSHGGRFGSADGAWSLPQTKRAKVEPGGWHEINENTPVQMCRTGFHLTDAANLRNWMGYNSQNRVWIAETEGPLLHNRDKYLSRKVRLLRELPPTDVQRLIDGGEIDRDMWLRNARLDNTTKYWDDRFDEVFDIVKDELPLDYLGESDLEDLRRTIRPYRQRNGYVDFARTFTDARKMFFEARYRYLLACGQKETEEQRDMRLQSKKSGRMIAHFIKGFLDINAIPTRLQQHGGEKAETAA
jgi:hypothetical protein